MEGALAQITAWTLTFIKDQVRIFIPSLFPKTISTKVLLILGVQLGSPARRLAERADERPERDAAGGRHRHVRRRHRGLRLLRQEGRQELIRGCDDPHHAQHYHYYATSTYLIVMPFLVFLYQTHLPPYILSSCQGMPMNLYPAKTLIVCTF